MADHATELQRLEHAVEKGMAAFALAGKALLEIRDRKLYRQDYRDWDEYTKTRWGWSRPQADRLIETWKIMEDLQGGSMAPNRSGTATPILPDSEWQARPLASLDDAEDRREAWARAVQAAGGRPTGEQVRQQVSILQHEQEEEIDQPEDEEDIEEVMARAEESLSPQKKRELIEAEEADARRRAARQEDDESADAQEQRFRRAQVRMRQALKLLRRLSDRDVSDVIAHLEQAVAAARRVPQAA